MFEEVVRQDLALAESTICLWEFSEKGKYTVALEVFDKVKSALKGNSVSFTDDEVKAFTVVLVRMQHEKRFREADVCDAILKRMH